MGAATGEVIIDDVALVVTTPSVDAAPNSTAPSPSENNYYFCVSVTPTLIFQPEI